MSDRLWTAFGVLMIGAAVYGIATNFMEVLQALATCAIAAGLLYGLMCVCIVTSERNK